MKHLVMSVGRAQKYSGPQKQKIIFITGQYLSLRSKPEELCLTLKKYKRTFQVLMEAYLYTNQIINLFAES